MRDLNRDRGRSGFLWLTAIGTCIGGVLAGASVGLLDPDPSNWLRVFAALCAAALAAYPLLNEDNRRDARYANTLVRAPEGDAVLDDYNLARLANLARRSRRWRHSCCWPKSCRGCWRCSSAYLPGCWPGTSTADATA